MSMCQYGLMAAMFVEGDKKMAFNHVTRDLPNLCELKSFFHNSFS